MIKKGDVVFVKRNYQKEYKKGVVIGIKKGFHSRFDIAFKAHGFYEIGFNFTDIKPI